MLGLSVVAAVGGAKYELIEISPDEPLPTLPRDLNGNNVLLGVIIDTNFQSTAFVWETGRVTRLEFGERNYADAINIRGDVVGGVWQSNKWEAWLHSAGTNYTLAPFAREFSHATDIDDDGRIIGIADGINYLFSKAGALRLNLPTTFPMNLQGTREPLLSTGFAVFGHYYARLESTNLINLRPLGQGSAIPTGLNSYGHIAGSYDERFYPRQAAIWNGTNWMLLGSVHNDAQANSINDDGDAVGVQFGDRAGAMLWRNQLGILLNSVTDLPPDTQLTDARTINNLGYIAATLLQNGRTRAVLLKPPEEPLPLPRIRLVTPVEKIHDTNEILYSIDLTGMRVPIVRATYHTANLVPGSSWPFRTNISVVPPFSVLLTNVPAGQYSIHISLEDAHGMEVFATPFFFGISRDTTLKAHRRNWDDLFEFTLSGSPGRLFLIEVSSDLRTWRPVNDTPFEAGYFHDDATAAQSFYRARVLKEDLLAFGSWNGSFPEAPMSSFEARRIVLFFDNPEKAISINCSWGSQNQAVVFKESLAAFQRAGSYKYVPKYFSGKFRVTAGEPRWELDLDLEYSLRYYGPSRFRGTLIDDTTTNFVSGPFIIL